MANNRFAEIECLTCGISYKIKMESEEYIPDMKFLFCPICGGSDCKAVWIEHDKTIYNNNKNHK